MSNKINQMLENIKTDMDKSQEVQINYFKINYIFIKQTKSIDRVIFITLPVDFQQKKQREEIIELIINTVFEANLGLENAKKINSVLENLFQISKNNDILEKLVTDLQSSKTEGIIYIHTKKHPTTNDIGVGCTVRLYNNKQELWEMDLGL